MRVLFLGTNWLGWQVLPWLKERREEIVGIVIHPPRRPYGDELVALADAISTFDGSRLREAAVSKSIHELKCDIAVSVLFGYILQPDFFALPSSVCINLHLSLLPYNRGAHPNVWSIIDGTPAGATLHYIDAGDTGDIIAQREVSIEATYTGATLYRKVELTSLDLFTTSSPAGCFGNAPRLAQEPAAGTSHRVCDVARVDAVDLEATYKAGYLINLIRARTFIPYRGAFFESEGRRVYMTVQLAYGDEAKS
jgi:methionyl-tRNA formyltransferase